ncbi:iron transporter [Natrialbaceae archaeon A-gly3]
MNRRSFLGVAGTTGTLAMAGCLEQLGFEEQSAWRDPPLVTDRPDAVYMPAAFEEMGVYGGDDDGEYAVELSYTFPHRFWTVTGTETNRVVVETDDTMHLMVTAWDAQTGHVLPADMSMEIYRESDGEVVSQRNLWAMISQRMGFHYGDNIELPEEGVYRARITVDDLRARRLGSFEGRFDSGTTLEVGFEYDRSDIHDLEFDEIDHGRRGDRAALELMDHADHDHGDHDGHGHDHGDGEHEHGHDHLEAPMPMLAAPPVEDLPGTHCGTERTGDAKLSLLETENAPVAEDGESYLVVTTRTPYNDVILPFTSLSVSLERGGEVVFENEPLTESLHHDFGHHYGMAADLEDGDELTVSVGSPPGVARHDGYETAFFEFEDVTFTI